MISKKIGSNVLGKTVNEHRDVANGKGNGFNRVLNLTKAKGEHGFFSPKAGESYRINIIPYEIKTKNHPSVLSGNKQIGEIDYSYCVKTHRRVGPAGLSIVCPKQFGKACPICEQFELTKDANLKAKERYFYNVEDIKDKGKVKIFETYGGKSSFETQLINRASADVDFGGGVVDFLSADGQGVQFTAIKDSFNGTSYTSFSVDKFFDRGGELPDEVYQNGVSFDEVVNIMSYDEILGLMNPSDDSESESAPTESYGVESNNDVSSLADEAISSPKTTATFDDMKPTEGNCKNCPFGHCFGKDANKFSDCDDCDMWESCVDNK